eukprot:352063-Chlamydomonas_euryale.AAC.3
MGMGHAWGTHGARMGSITLLIREPSRMRARTFARFIVNTHTSSAPSHTRRHRGHCGSSSSSISGISGSNRTCSVISIGRSPSTMCAPAFSPSRRAATNSPPPCTPRSPVHDTPDGPSVHACMHACMSTYERADIHGWSERAYTRMYEHAYERADTEGLFHVCVCVPACTRRPLGPLPWPERSQRALTELVQVCHALTELVQVCHALCMACYEDGRAGKGVRGRMDERADEDEHAEARARVHACMREQARTRERHTHARTCTCIHACMPEHA